MNPYEILGVSNDADDKELKRARRKLAAELHPDREGGDTEKMAIVNWAYDLLSDKQRRARYDAGEGVTRQKGPYQLARELVLGMMLQGFQQKPKCNVPVYVLREIEKLKDGHRDRLAMETAKRAELLERRDEVSTDEPVNMFADMIDGLIRETDSRIEQMEIDGLAMNLALEIARRYHSDVTVPIQRYAPERGRVGLDRILFGDPGA